MAKISNWTKRSARAVGSTLVEMRPSYSKLSKEGMIILSDVNPDIPGHRRQVLTLTREEMIRLRDTLNSFNLEA